VAAPPPPPDPADEAAEPDDPVSVARLICIRALTARARTRSELATTLRRRGIPDDAATVVLDRFTELGFIDDAALAAEFTQLAHAERGLSRRAVATKLQHRGVDAAVIATAITAIDSESEYAAATSLATRKARSLTGLDPQTRLRRLVGLLARRGYAPSLAYRVAREVLDADVDSDMDRDLNVDISAD
jgi:regulatory protein